MPTYVFCETKIDIIFDHRFCVSSYEFFDGTRKQILEEMKKHNFSHAVVLNSNTNEVLMVVTIEKEFLK